MVPCAGEGRQDGDWMNAVAGESNTFCSWRRSEQGTQKL